MTVARKKIFVENRNLGADTSSSEWPCALSVWVKSERQTGQLQAEETVLPFTHKKMAAKERKKKKLSEEGDSSI